MYRVDNLVDVTGLAGPRSRVDNLVFFRVRGNCLSPTIQDGDVVLAAWRLLSVAQFAPARGEVAVFLVRWPGEERAAVVLNRWPCTGSHGAPATLASNTGEVTLTSSQVALLADRVRLVQRGGSFNPNLLAGTVYAGLDIWFADDVKRTLRVAAAYETMSSSMRATPPLNPEAAGAYQQGFVDALRAVGVAFGVATSAQLPGATRRPPASRTIDAEPGDGNRRAHSPWSSGWNRER